MPSLHVCPLSRLPETVAATGASHVLTLINVGTPLERPAVIDAENHAVIGVSDIAAARDGHVLPAEEHVARVLDFVRAWPREKPLVIHCYAGISRSTAAAFIAACALAPERDEAAIADALRAASPSATPNPLFVAIADRMLGRDGRMVAAIARIGRSV
ncbi:MAG: protein tyrosine phosphatase [Hyphomicrobiales bacterium]